MHAAEGPAWALALEHTALAEAMRGGIYLYPAVETGHILGFALLIGAILVLDARLLGLGRGVRPAALARLAIPIAAAGFALAVAMGGLLFVTEAAAYLRNPFFLAKLALIAAGLANIVVFHRYLKVGIETWPADGLPPPRVRLSAAISATVWIAVPICGRLIAYI